MTVICKHCAQEHDEIGLLACFESQVKCWREERDQIKAWGLGLEQKLDSAQLEVERLIRERGILAGERDGYRLQAECMTRERDGFCEAFKASEKERHDALLQVESLTDILWKGLACLDLHGGNNKELNAKWVAQARALGDRLEVTEKRIESGVCQHKRVREDEFWNEVERRVTRKCVDCGVTLS